jgi:hypothetical protein
MRGRFCPSIGERWRRARSRGDTRIWFRIWFVSPGTARCAPTRSGLRLLRVGEGYVGTQGDHADAGGYSLAGAEAGVVF